MALSASSIAIARVGPATGGTKTTVAFDAPANSAIVVGVTVDTAGQQGTTCTMSNSGTPLTWSEEVRRTGEDTVSQPGTVIWFVALVPTARTAMTVTLTTGSTTRNNTFKPYLVTGVDVADFVGAVGSGTVGSNNNVLTVADALTTQRADSLVFIAANESQLGPGAPTTPTSGFVIDAYVSSGNCSGVTGYLTAGAAGDTPGFAVDAAGTSTAISWNWAALEIMATSGTAHTRTVTDPVGVVDTTVRTTSSARTVTDPVGVVDTTARATASARTVTDPVGVVDQAVSTVVAARMFTRFADGTLGAAAPGWTAFGAVPFSQQLAADTHGERHMRVQKASGIGGLTWDDVPVVADVEVFAEVQSTSGATASGRFKVGARMDPATVVGYFGGHGQTIQERLIKYTPASATIVESAVARYPAGTRIRIRMRVSGTTLQCKVWQFGEHEPTGWELTTTDTSLAAAGRVGVFSFGSAGSATDTRVYGFGVGNGGATAPHTHLPAPIWDQVPRQIGFPFTSDVAVTYDADDWDELRDGGTRRHRGLDMYVPIGTPVYAMTAGTIDSFMPGISETADHLAGGGYQLRINTLDGKLRYGYAHFGPKAPGGAALAFAPGIVPGATVAQGQLLGWSGESGSTASGPHLHIDIRDLSGVVTDDPYADYGVALGTEDAPRFNPYPSIIAATALPGRAVTDPVGITDTVTTAQAHVRTIVDPVGVVDLAVGAQGHIRTATDAVGVLDTAAAAQAASRTVTDPVGLLDAHTFDVGAGDTVTDPVSVVDVVERQHDAARPVVDPVGITDVVQAAQAHVRTITDPLGIVDAATAAQAYERALVDPVGVLDDVAGAQAASRAVTDPVGLLDAAARVVDSVRELADPLGLLDLAAAAQDHRRDLVDPLALADTVEQAAAHARTAVDPVGLLDETAGAQDHARTLADPVGVDDAVAAVQDHARALVDPVGVVDDTATAQDWSATLADPVGVLDEAATAQDHRLELVDALGLLDQVERQHAADREVVDVLALLDTTGQARGIAVDLVDQVGVLDDVERQHAAVLELLDALGVGDVVTFVGGLPAVLVPGRHVATGGGPALIATAGGPHLEAT